MGRKAFEAAQWSPPKSLKVGTWIEIGDIIKVFGSYTKLWIWSQASA
jgi:hypothetical protein